MSTTQDSQNERRLSRLIWADETTDLAVAVNGGLIEISLPDGWSGRLLPSEVDGLGAAFTQALADAVAMTERWDIVTGSYQEVTAMNADREPKTIPEQLDAARNGAEFLAALNGVFAALEKAMDEE